MNFRSHREYPGGLALWALSVVVLGNALQCGEARSPTTPGLAGAALDDFIIEAISLTDTAGKPRVILKEHELAYDFGPESAPFQGAKQSYIDKALEVLVRAAAIDRDLKAAAPGETFWNQSLEDIRRAGSAFLSTTQESGALGRQTAGLQFLKRASSDLEAVEAGLLTYGNRKGLNVTKQRGEFEGFLADIKIDPPKTALVRYVPYLVYLRSRLQKSSLEDEWLDLNEGKRILAGRYHYRADWPPSLNGPVEGNFEVHANTTITFHPKAN